VYIPAFVKARELGKILSLDAKEVVKFARSEGFKFRKPHQIILSFPYASKLALKRSKNPVYLGAYQMNTTTLPVSLMTERCTYRNGRAARRLLVKRK
jgi:hypothetical protein